MIQVKDIVKTFQGSKGEVRALRRVSFEVGKGQLFTLLGPSGCGKTTTLRCIAGLEQPASGDILVGGRRVFSSSHGTFVSPEQRRIGMVFQSYAIWPHMTVFQNVAYALGSASSRKDLAAGQPVFLDCVTFRSGTYSSHFGETRPGIEKEIARWEPRDPLKRMADWLFGRGMASPADLERLRQDEEQRIEAAFHQVLAETKGNE